MIEYEHRHLPLKFTFWQFPIAIHQSMTFIHLERPEIGCTHALPQLDVLTIKEHVDDIIITLIGVKLVIATSAIVYIAESSAPEVEHSDKLVIAAIFKSLNHNVTSKRFSALLIRIVSL